MQRTKRLTAFTASYAQAAVIFPYILVAPAYFAEKIQLGGMMQTASAFGSVQDALSFFITVVPHARRMAVGGARLDGFETIDRKRHRARRRPADIDSRGVGRQRRRSTSRSLLVSLPNGTPLVAADGFSIRQQ